MMKRLLFALIAVASVVFAADPTGKWVVTVRDIKLELTIKNDAGKWSGIMSSAAGEVALKDVQLSGDQLKYNLSIGDSDYAVKFTVAENSMTGTYSGAGGSGEVKAERQAAAGASARTGVTGKWKVVARSSAGRAYNLEMIVTEESGKFSGTIGNGDGSIPLEKVKFESGQLAFGFNYEGTYAVKMTQAGSGLKGSYTDPDGKAGEISATR